MSRAKQPDRPLVLARGVDYIKFYMVEGMDAACAAPFVSDKGKIKVPVLAAKLPVKSAFRSKTFDVNPGNFAKVRCYLKDAVKDPRNAAVHCDGINIYGEPVASELERSGASGDGFATISKDDRRDNEQVSTKLSITCTAVLTKQAGFDDVLETGWDDDDVPK